MLYVILPAYNEEQNLPPLFERLAALDESISGGISPLVVDDGSTDHTAEVADRCGARLGVQVLRHPTNRGLGAALWTGIRMACAQSSPRDTIGALDADNSHDPCHFVPMMARMAEGYDVVIASRYAPGGQEIGLSGFRRLGSRVTNALLARTFPIPCARDYTCGFRAYRSEILRKGLEVYGDELITETTFVCMAELLIKLHSVGARVAESPLVLRYDLKRGKSKMRIARTALRYVRFTRTERRRILRIAKSHTP